MDKKGDTMIFTNPRHGKRIITANWEIIIAPGETEIIIRARGVKKVGRHDALLQALVKYLIKKGYKVRADGVNVPSEALLKTPLTVGRSRIDAVAFDGFKYLYYEVKTLAELTSEHTKRQLLEYARELTEFFLVVPQEAEDRAKELVEILRIKDKCKILVITPTPGSPEYPATIKKIQVEDNEIGIYFNDFEPHTD